MRNLKIILIGPSGVGKTTLRKIFFEQENPLKLLNQTLEPTRGVETRIYDIEGAIAIHDLAGQQLEEWFTQSFDIFSSTDLIIVVLNSSDEWEENKVQWERVKFQRQRVCPEAQIMILFHKVDKLDENQRQKLEWDIQTTFVGEHNISAFTSSIVVEFFLETFKRFVGAFRKVILSIHEVGVNEVFQRVDILIYFLDRSTLKLDDLIASMKLPAKVARKILEDMYKRNYIKIDESTNSITLGEQGMFLINGLNNIGIHAAIDTFKEIPLMKGVIFADYRGICFFIHEYKRGYFEKLLPSGEKFPDPNLVSGFMSAIGGFASEISQDLNAINLTGMEAQIISQRFEDLICIFFIENIPSNQSLFDILMKFVRTFYGRFKNEVNTVIKSGNVGGFESKSGEIDEMIKDLNGKLHELVLKHSAVTATQLISIYQKVDLAGLDPDIVKDIKQLIFHYTITQKEEDLVNIDTLLEKFHIR